MKNILLLGNKGYIGSYLEYALSERYNITGVDIGWFVEDSCPIDPDQAVSSQLRFSNFTSWTLSG